MHIGTTHDHLSQLLAVAAGHPNWHGELLSRLCRHTDLVDAKVGVGANHRTRTEVDTLAGEVAPEPALLAFQSLGEGFEGSSRAVPSRRDSAGLVVEVGGAVVLQQFPEVLDDELRGASVAVLTQTLVDSEDVY